MYIPHWECWSLEAYSSIYIAQSSSRFSKISPDSIMDISLSIIHEIGFPTLALHLPITVVDISEKLSSWDTSVLNPKNRVDCAEPTCTSKLGWRIDGSADEGTRFFAIPTTLLPNLPPLRIDVFIPEQTEHPPEFRDALQSNFSAVLKDSRVANLGVSHYICHVLDHWSRGDPNFLRSLRTLPFGSKIIIPKITSPKYSPVHVIPAHDLERNLLSVRALQVPWKDDILPVSWPPMVDIYELQLHAQIHDSISLVYIPSRHRDEILIFKSTATEPRFLYHELKVLLTLPPHPNVLSKPLYVVAKRCAFGGKNAVCGFILPYYSAGSLKEALPSRALNGTLTLNTQLKWACQITAALLHVHSAGTFYADLKPENILLSPSLPDEDYNSIDDDLILIDFEQRGNWFAWSAPETLYHEYLEIIVSSLPPEKTAKFAHLLSSYFPAADDVRSRVELDSKKYTNPQHGYCASWIRLILAQQESATVHALGKLLWCVFEGQANVQHSIRNSLRYEPDLEFPAFRRTPEKLRELIYLCTRDTAEWRCQTRERRSKILRI